MPASSPSPFAALSFSEQQEQWRIFRAQHLDFQEVPPKQEPPRPVPAVPRAPAYTRSAAPQHSNLDRVRAQLAAASRRAGSFQNITSKE